MLSVSGKVPKTATLQSESKGDGYIQIVSKHNPNLKRDPSAH